MTATAPSRPAPASRKPVSPGEVQMAFYWAMKFYLEIEPEGLPPQSERLREICRVSQERWASIKPLVFDGRHCFYLTAGRWHHVEARRQAGKAVS